MKKFLLLVSIVFVISACKKEETRDVQYYIDHPKERQEKNAECQNNPGELEETKNCKNASEAELKAVFNPKNKGMPQI